MPGASVVLRGGLVTYIEDTKIALAGVAPQLLDAVGPVAAPTARALAVGARQRCGATWGVGLTGVAGPEPHGGHPVGTVFLGLAGPVDTEVVAAGVFGFTLGHPDRGGARGHRAAAGARRAAVSLRHPGTNPASAALR